MSGATFRTLLLFLYGLACGSAKHPRLRLMDVDLTLGLVTIRDAKFYKSRLVPARTGSREADPATSSPAETTKPTLSIIVSTKSGGPIAAQVADASFSRLRRIAGIERRDDSYFQPRLHDLRAHIAIHRLTQWYRQNANLQRMLPALSTYLGHVDLECDAEIPHHDAGAAPAGESSLRAVRMWRQPMKDEARSGPLDEALSTAIPSYGPQLRANTQHSYRDALRLFVIFASATLHKKPDELFRGGSRCRSAEEVPVSYRGETEMLSRDA